MVEDEELEMQSQNSTDGNPEAAYTLGLESIKASSLQVWCSGEESTR